VNLGREVGTRIWVSIWDAYLGRVYVKLGRVSVHKYTQLHNITHFHTKKHTITHIYTQNYTISHKIYKYTQNSHRKHTKTHKIYKYHTNITILGGSQRIHILSLLYIFIYIYRKLNRNS